MGEYTNHIIRVEPKKYATKENYMALIECMDNNLGYGSFNYHDGLLDDSNWNDGSGTKWYEIEETLEAVARRFPEWTVRVDCVPEAFSWLKDFEEYGPYSYVVSDGSVEYHDDCDIDWFEKTYGANGEKTIRFEIKTKKQ